jgi:hypothetical protein
MYADCVQITETLLPRVGEESEEERMMRSWLVELHPIPDTHHYKNKEAYVSKCVVRQNKWLLGDKKKREEENESEVDVSEASGATQCRELLNSASEMFGFEFKKGYEYEWLASTVDNAIAAVITRAASDIQGQTFLCSMHQLYPVVRPGSIYDHAALHSDVHRVLEVMHPKSIKEMHVSKQVRERASVFGKCQSVMKELAGMVQGTKLSVNAPKLENVNKSKSMGEGVMGQDSKQEQIVGCWSQKGRKTWWEVERSCFRIVDGVVIMASR